MKATKKVIVVTIEAKLELDAYHYPTEISEILDRLRETGDAEIIDLTIKDPYLKLKEEQNEKV